MASLDRHTLTPRLEEHAKLPFRADCPYCREVRLRGTFPSPEVIPRRAKAGLLAGALAASGAAPTATTLAQPPAKAEGRDAVLPPGGVEAEDSEQEGDPPAVELGGAPKRPGPPVTGPRPEVKPPKPAVPRQDDRGRRADEPRERGPDRSAAPSSRSRPQEPAPLARSPAPDRGHENEEAAGGSRAERPARRAKRERRQDPTPHSPAGANPATPTSGAPPEPGSPGTRTNAEGPREAAAKPEPEQAAPRRKVDQDQAGTPDARAGGDAGAGGEPPQRRGTAGNGVVEEPRPEGRHAEDVSRGSPDVRRVADGSDTPRSDGERVHVVRPGESLWAIAERGLGPDASDGEIAQEVNRLWELNDTEVIKTGDPDLILPGQRLRL